MRHRSSWPTGSPSGSAACWPSTRCRCRSTDGEVVGVIGPNGAGKTTLFNVISGFVHPSSGTITYRGAVLRRHHPHDLAKLGHRAHPAGHRPLSRADRARERDARRRTEAAQRPRIGVPRHLALEPGGAPRGGAGHGGPRRARCRRLRPPDPRRAPLRHTEAHRAGPRPHGGAAAPAARRAGERALRERDGRAGIEGPRADRAHVRAPRRAPHGPGDVGVRPSRRPQLRPGHRGGHTGGHPGRPRRGDRLPRRPRP